MTGRTNRKTGADPGRAAAGVSVWRQRYGALGPCGRRENKTAARRTSRGGEATADQPPGPLRTPAGAGRPREALVQRHRHQQVDVVTGLIGQGVDPAVVAHVDPVVPALEQQRVALLL